MTILNHKMIITDLDGTLFNNNQEVSLTDMESLFWLGQNDIVRVIATGRNFYSVTKVLKNNFPIDYLIFSTGAGIYDWKNRKIIYSRFLPSIDVKQISKFLIEHEADFMIHEVIPENHKFVYHQSHNVNPDFITRIKFYKGFASALNPITETYQHACQILAIFPKENGLFEEVNNRFKNVKIIRTTSPFDGKSVWMEIFPETVSKGHGINWLCKNLNINPLKTISVGNDYNDLEMLEFTPEKYVVSNAPNDLKEKFPVCGSNQESGFSDALSRHFSISYI